MARQRRTQNRRQKVFNRGALRVCGGLDIIKLIKLHWFIVFHVSIWGVEALFGEAKPTKAPRGDRTARNPGRGVPTIRRAPQYILY